MSYAVENRAWLVPLIRKLAGDLGLHDWDLRLADDAPEVGTAGQCHVTYGRRLARIMLAEPDDHDDLIDTIIHELLHCHFEPISWAAESLRRAVGDMVFNVWEGSQKDTIEIAIDAIAAAMTRRYDTEDLIATARKEGDA